MIPRIARSIGLPLCAVGGVEGGATGAVSLGFEVLLAVDALAQPRGLGVDQFAGAVLVAQGAVLG